MTGPPAEYRKKPVVIEAVQFVGGNLGNLDSLIEWAGGRRSEEGNLVIPTLEGDHLAMPGDWIVRGVKGEFYPCKPDIFEATYEAASGGSGEAPAPVRAPNCACGAGCEDGICTAQELGDPGCPRCGREVGRCGMPECPGEAPAGLLLNIATVARELRRLPTEHVARRDELADYLDAAVAALRAPSSTDGREGRA